MSRKRSGNRPIGSPVERIEDLRFLRGRGRFVDDVPIQGALHAVVLRSPQAHGRIRNVDCAVAREWPGVHAVVTAADVERVLGEVPVIAMRQELRPEFAPYQQPVIAHEKVRYVGEPIAVVLADSAALAEDAMETIALDIEPLPPVADRDASRADAGVLFKSTGTNRVTALTAARGDADAAFRDAPYVRRERFSVQRFAALPMEPRGLLAQWDKASGHLTVHGAAKVAFHNRRLLARQLGLAEDAITMIEADVGGGFGQRGEFYPEDFLMPFAGKAARPPGEMDRGPARAPDRVEPRARRRLRTGNRLRARRHDPRLRGRGAPTSAPTSAPTASPPRETPCRC
jgi:aerobic carbon-monoxide dehydrogenase large subunit